MPLLKQTVLKLEAGLEDEAAYLSVLGLMVGLHMLELWKLANQKKVKLFCISCCWSDRMLAGQIAKKAGCKVIGLAGSEEKCNWLVNDLDLIMQ